MKMKSGSEIQMHQRQSGAGQATTRAGEAGDEAEQAGGIGQPVCKQEIDKQNNGDDSVPFSD